MMFVARRIASRYSVLRCIAFVDSSRLSTSVSSNTRPARRLKPWNDPRLSTEKRVQALMDANQIHPADFHSKEIENLLRTLGKQKLAGLEQAHNVLERFVSEKKRLCVEEGLRVVIPEKLWQILVFGWVQLADKVPAATLRIEALVETVIELAQQDQRDPQLQNPKSTPTTAFFNTVLDGLARASRFQASAPKKAEDMLDLMEELRRDRQFHTRPNSRSYVYVMQAYQRSKMKHTGDRALIVFRRLQKEQAEREIAYRQQYGQEYNHKQPETNMIRIPTADIVCYSVCMQAILDCPDTPAQLAVDLLGELLQAGIPEPDAAIFSLAIKAFGEQVKGIHNVNHKRELLERAEDVLRMMIQASRMYNEGWDLVYGYNACLNAWANAHFPEAPEGAERLLKALLESGDAEPDVVSFNCALHAWARATKFHSHAASRAEQLLEFQHELLAKGALGRCALPDFRTYAIVIQAYATSSDRNKAQHARRVLEHMFSRLEVDEVNRAGNSAAPFTAVLNACARVPTETESADTVDDFTSEVETNDDYELAIQTFTELCEDSYGIDAEPDHHAYAAFLQCILKHSPAGTSDRHSMVQMAFEDACKRGCVSRIVIEAIQKLDATLLGEGGRMPSFWSRNVEPNWLPRVKGSSGRK